MRRRPCIPTCALVGLFALACTLTPDGNAQFGSGTSPGAGDDDDDRDTEGDDADESGSGGGADGGESGASDPGSGGEDDGADSGPDSDSDPDPGPDPETTGGTATSGDDGQEGPACASPGDTVVSGSSGPANANQNCPTTTYTATVPGSPGDVADIEVLLDASVATTSEFTATLQGPSGTVVTLFDRHGGPFSDDFIDTYVDDASPSPLATAAAPRTGCFAPDEPLSAFHGQPAGGTWTLTVQTCLYAVTVHSWELRISH